MSFDTTDDNGNELLASSTISGAQPWFTNIQGPPQYIQTLGLGTAVNTGVGVNYVQNTNSASFTASSVVK